MYSYFGMSIVWTSTDSQTVDSNRGLWTEHHSTSEESMNRGLGQWIVD